MFFSQLLLPFILLLQSLCSFALEPFNITCPSPDKCTCVSEGNDSYQISCPNENNYNYQVFVNLPHYVEILCNSRVNNQQNYDSLTGLKVGAVQSLRFYFCWLPQNTSLAEFAQTIDVKTIPELKLTSSKDLAKFVHDIPLAGFENLERLNLYDNRLENLPVDFLHGFNNLKLLNLGLNKISRLDKNFFSFLPKLENLHLGGNGFTSLEDGFFATLTNLKTLNLFVNGIEKLSRSFFSNLTNLEELDVSYNKLQTLPADVFEDLGNLRRLEISGNNFSSIPEAFSTLFLKLEYLGLSGNKEIFTLPGYYLSNFTRLRDLQLSSNRFPSITDQIFWNCTYVTKIDFGFNKLQSLPQLLFRDLIHLQHLNLRGNYLEDIPDYVFKHLAELEELDLESNRLLNISRYSFHGLDKLKILKLGNNRLSYLNGEPFKLLQQLKHADLSYNQLSFKEIIAEDNTSLTVAEDRSPFQYCINLENLKLTSNSIEKVFKDWRLNLTKLRNLDLSYNKIQRLNADDIYFVSDSVSLSFARNQISVIGFSGIEDLAAGLWSTYPPRTVKGKIEVTVDRNPLVCDCQAYDFIRYYNNGTWPSGVNFTLILKQGDLKCAEPQALSYVHVKNVDHSKLC